MTKIHSEGKCFFCGEIFKKAAISRHLITHIKEKGVKNKAGKSYLVSVAAEEMFLIFWADGKSTLKQLDIYMRRIWLECCGHMSKFVNPKKSKNEKRTAFDFMTFENYKAPGEIEKKEKAEKVFSKGTILDYEYDYGSSTFLKIKVIEEFPFIADDTIVLLSRNEPLEILCNICNKKTATQICAVCAGYNEAMFCKECAKIHKKKCEDFADYANMPVVNSPRMGTCAYAGGEIDKNRDGVFIRKK